MRILLDTQCFVLAATEGWTKLPKRVQRLLLEPETRSCLSVISLAEIAIKTQIGKLNMPSERAQTAVNDLRLDVLPFTTLHVHRFFELPLHHREPFDRLLIATALVENIPIVGGDARFPLYKSQGLGVIWK
jgi:PIN domain nuclease of toxin-antitoxin system